MSSVLRPKNLVKKSSEEEGLKDSLQVASPEISAQGISNNNEVTHVDKIAVGSEVQAQTKNVESIKSQEDTLLDEENAKEAKISAVLQEILDRKIDKAIVSAEASLEGNATVSNTHIQGENSIVTPVVNGTTPHLSNVEMSPVFVTPVETLKNPGQEIRISVPVQAVSPLSNQTTTPGVTTPPVVSNINVVPVHVITKETVPVVTHGEQVISPVVSPGVIQPAQVVPATQAVVPEQKVHWFDKLFGSAPKNPPQVL